MFSVRPISGKENLAHLRLWSLREKKIVIFKAGKFSENNKNIVDILVCKTDAK